jgi:hypothetical protein
MTEAEIAWLAGLLEGEAYFHFRHTPTISLAMTDEDVVAKAAKLFRKTYRKRIRKILNRKDVFVTEVFGPQALWLMKLIKPYMGSRRSAKIQEITKLSAERPGQVFGERAGRAKITNSQAVEVKRRYLASFGKHRGDTSSVIAKEFGISQSAVRYTAVQRRFA